MRTSLKVALLDESRIEDRLSVCFGHFSNWKTKKLVEEVRAWSLRRLRDIKQFCYVAYEEGKASGFIGFLPIPTIQKWEMNPYRMRPTAMPSAEYEETKFSQIPYPNPLFTNDVFISCLWVQLPFIRRGIGTALIKRLVHDLKEEKILPNLEVDGVQVYIEKRLPD